MADIWAEIKRLASLIRQLQGALGGKTIRIGTQTLTWAGAVATSDFPTVTHGLSTTPTVLATFPMGFLSAGGKFAAVTPSSIGVATFVVQAITTYNTVPVNGTTCLTGWVAIG